MQLCHAPVSPSARQALVGLPDPLIVCSLRENIADLRASRNPISGISEGHDGNQVLVPWNFQELPRACRQNSLVKMTSARIWQVAWKDVSILAYLVATARASAIGMDSDVAGVDHQPLKVRVVDDRIQQLVPDPPVPPAAKPPMGIIPVSVIRGQIPPRRPGAQDPEHSVQKQLVVLSRAASFGNSSGLKEAANAPNPVPKGRDADAPLP